MDTPFLFLFFLFGNIMHTFWRNYVSKLKKERKRGGGVTHASGTCGYMWPKICEKCLRFIHFIVYFPLEDNSDLKD
jgi:hypothetical protein